MDKEEEKTDRETIVKARNEAVKALVNYLDTFYPPPARSSNSKHALMGPVGKLLSRLMTTGDINWEALKGYILSIHKNQQSERGVSTEAANRLDESINALRNLNDLMPPTRWLKTLEDIDDEVFFLLFKGKLSGQRQFIKKQFIEWLQTKYKSVDEINNLLKDAKYGSFDQVDDPFSTPVEMKPIVDEFWKERKSKEEQ